MERHNDAYGTCPRCEHIGWHRYKKKAIIFGENKRKYKVSLFKCPKCGKKFGFELDGDIPEPKVSITDRLLGRKEEEDEFDKMLEALSDDYDKDFKISPDEVSDIISELEIMADAVDSGNLNADNGATILLSIKSIGDIFEKVTSRG